MNLKNLILIGFTCAVSISYASNWIQRADFGTNGRHRGTGMSIGTKGYIGFGHYNGAGPNIVFADWWEYDPATNAWTQKADYTGNNGNGTYAVITFGMDNVGFVGSGQVGAFSDFYKFDPVANTWTAAANCPTSFANRTGFVIDNKGYCMAGNALYEYDSATDIWTLKNPAPFTMGIWNSTFTIDGKGYVKSAGNLFEYKSTTDEWIPRAPFPGIATAGSVGLAQNGKGLIFTGYSGSLANVCSEVWQYDPWSNTWTAKQEFYGTSRRFASGFSIGERCFIGTGTNGTNFNDFWEFDEFSGLEEMFDINQFTCYPNPAVETVNFHSENLSSFTVRVYNSLGQEVRELRTSNHSIQFNKENLDNGIYPYLIEVDGEIVHSNKFIFK
jgi:N-acetylneuraminic acid mutarotase